MITSPKLHKTRIRRKPISRGAEWCGFQLHSTFHFGVKLPQRKDPKKFRSLSVLTLSCKGVQHLQQGQDIPERGQVVALGNLPHMTTETVRLGATEILQQSECVCVRVRECVNLTSYVPAIRSDTRKYIFRLL